MAYAILGPPGTFSEVAARAYWGPGVELLGVDDIGQIGGLLGCGRVSGALVPLHNTITGWVDQTLRLLKSYQLPIKGKIELPVVQHLMVYGPYRCSDLKVIISHPIALEQCQGFIDKVLGGVKLETHLSTAAAARGLSRERRKAACIGSERAAQLYNLQILAANIGPLKNHTCFVHVEYNPLLDLLNGGNPDCKSLCI